MGGTNMIWPWNRKKLFVGSDAQEAARVWSTLQANHIPYSLTTKGMEPTMVRGMHANMAAGVTKGAARYADVTRPMNLAVGSPRRPAIQPCAASCIVMAKIKGIAYTARS